SLAELNYRAGLPLIFWGNIRFDRRFSPDVAAVLAAGGLVGVSAGIEVATESGLKRLCKGISLADIVRNCAAFKEAGILVHGYLIYGYWDQEEQELIDAAETVRQLFAAGLLDSAFWHQFVLTCHSRLYDETQRGLHPGFEVVGDANTANSTRVFARNDLSFEGEDRYGKYGEGLDRLLAAWMAGETGTPVMAAFPFKVPRPSAPPFLVERLLDGYARDRDAAREAPPDASGRLVFLGSHPMLEGNESLARLSWRWRLEERRLKIRGRDRARRIAALLEAAARGTVAGGEKTPAGDLYRELGQILGKDAAEKAWRSLRRGGLAVYAPPLAAGPPF
ncbi:MAG: radical SAM protein, partial [Treponema sp.]|nr:radical SAM protein [Treponema sp.]